MSVLVRRVEIMRVWRCMYLYECHEVLIRQVLGSNYHGRSGRRVGAELEWVRADAGIQEAPSARAASGLQPQIPNWQFRGVKEGHYINGAR